MLHFIISNSSLPLLWIKLIVWALGPYIWIFWLKIPLGEHPTRTPCLKTLTKDAALPPAQGLSNEPSHVFLAIREHIKLTMLRTDGRTDIIPFYI